MAFCSECGFLLPPKVAICPRCSSAVMPVEDLEHQNTDDPTIISALDKTEQSRNAYSAKPNLAQEPERLGGYNNWTQSAEQGQNTPTSSSAQYTPFPGYYTPTPIPPPPPEYMVRSDSEFSTTQGGSYPGSVFSTGPGTLPPPILAQKDNRKRNLLVMLLILFLVIATLGATAAIFIVGPDRVLQAVRGGGISPQPTSQVSTPAPSTSVPPTSQVPTPTPVQSTPTPTLTPGQQAQMAIDRYFTAINNKDYHTAYNLWINYPDTYQNFANGFADTQHDNYQFGQAVIQGDGTVQVNITLIATSTSSQQTTYQGYYMLGQQSNGLWKIITASMKQA